MARLAIIARADATGLGNQTRRLVEMLNPERVLVIDSTPFNQNQQDFTFPSNKTLLMKIEVILLQQTLMADTKIKIKKTYHI